MTDIEPAIRKALRPRIGNVERRTRYLLDAHAVAVAAALARERKRHDDAQRVMADDINRIAAERDDARETAANLATVWDRERETMTAHIGALEGELERAKDLAAELRKHVDGRDKTIARLREQLAGEDRCPECNMPRCMHHDPGCSHPCGACATPPGTEPAAQTPAPGARSAPRARRAARVGPEIETGAQAVTGPHSGGSETEGATG